MDPVHSSLASTIETIRAILNRNTVGVTLIVCPESSMYLGAYRRYAAILLPEGATLCGHMVTRHDGSQVAFLGGSDTKNAPDGVPFTVEFLGWGSDVLSDIAVMQWWLNRAAFAR